MPLTIPVRMPTQRILLLAYACATFALSACGPKAVRPRIHRTYSIEQFMATEKVWGSSFSADSKQILYTSNASGVFNAFAVPVTGGSPTQLTESTTSNVRAICFFPNDDRLILAADAEGNERFHLFVRYPDGRILDLTPDSDARADFLMWRHDLKGFYYSSNRRNGRAPDLYECDIQTLRSRLVWTNDEAFEVMSVSHNNRYLALLRSNTAADADIYFVDLDKGPAARPLLVGGDEVNHTPLSFSLDDSKIYMLSNEGSEFMYFQSLDIATGVRSTLHRENWDVLYGFHSYNGKYRVILTNEDARVVVKLFDAASGRQIDLPKLPQGEITKVDISRSERYMSFYVNSSASPNNLFVYDLELSTYRQLTNTLNPQIAPEDLVTGEVVRYPSFDGLEIPAILYRPHMGVEALASGQKPPAIINLHGGPGGISRLTYSPIIQFLVNHGYLVIDLNYRGSMGYGKTFYAADNRKHGDADLKDVIWAKRFLSQSGLVDTARIAVLGGSYGGYLVLSALTQYPTEFAAGVDLFGLSELVETLKNLPPWWEHVRRAYYVEFGDPVTDAEFLRAKSPYYFAERIQRPLMVLQGGNDARVRPQLTDAMVERIRRAGGEVTYLVFPDEGHGFYKKANEIEAYGSVLRFLDTHVKGTRRGPLAGRDSLAALPALTTPLPSLGLR